MTDHILTLIDRKKKRSLKNCHRGAVERFHRERLAACKRSPERKQSGVGCVVQTIAMAAGVQDSGHNISASAGAAQQKTNCIQVDSTRSWVLGSFPGEAISSRREALGIRENRSFMIEVTARRPGYSLRHMPCAGALLPPISKSNHAHITNPGREAERGSIPRQGFLLLT